MFTFRVIIVSDSKKTKESRELSSLLNSMVSRSEGGISHSDVRELLEGLRRVTESMNERHCQKLGDIFTSILDQHYLMCTRGEKANLRVMSDNLGINYDSLRQAKIRYDQKRRVSGD